MNAFCKLGSVIDSVSFAFKVDFEAPVGFKEPEGLPQHQEEEDTPEVNHLMSINFILVCHAK